MTLAEKSVIAWIPNWGNLENEEGGGGLELGEAENECEGSFSVSPLFSILKSDQQL